MTYQHLQDENLIDLLFTREDSLPREAVDEFVRRGEQMVGPLAEIISHHFYWNGDDENWWAVINATFILGAIGSGETVLPLLKALRHAAAYDCDWVTEAIASIFGKVGVKAVEGLKKIALDDSSDWYVRAIAIDGLAAITVGHPEKEIFDFIGSIFTNEAIERDVRRSAANTLLDFQNGDYKEALYDYAKSEKVLLNMNENYSVDLTVDDIDYSFSKENKNLWHYTRDWLSFYNEEQIAERQERWAKEDEEDEMKEIAEDEDIVCSCTDPFVRDLHKIGRNAPCPCGSGKKYKKCCGMEH